MSDNEEGYGFQSKETENKKPSKRKAVPAPKLSKSPFVRPKKNPQPMGPKIIPDRSGKRSSGPAQYGKTATVEDCLAVTVSMNGETIWESPASRRMRGEREAPSVLPSRGPSFHDLWPRP